jgi:hypothetical protein
MSAEDIQDAQSGGRRRQTPAMRARSGYGPKVLPPDIAREYLARTVAGQPQQQSTYQQDIELPAAHDTLSVYSILPANAGHFNYGVITNVNVSGLSPIQNNVPIFSQVVPAGRVAIVRAVQVNIEGWTGMAIPTDAFTFTVLRNGNAEVFNQNIFCQAFDDPYNVLLIAGPNDIISVTVSFDFSSVTGPYVGGPDFLVHVAGDILIQNEMPVPYTALKSAPVRVVQS